MAKSNEGRKREIFECPWSTKTQSMGWGHIMERMKIEFSQIYEFDSMI